MRTLSLFLAALLAAAALAGCTGNDDDGETDPTPVTSTPEATTTPSDPFATPPTATTTPVVTPVVTPPATLDNASFVLATVGAPLHAKPNMSVNFTLYVNGTTTTVTDHIGAHYADNTTTSPPAAGRRDCAHTNGTLPGVFNVSCTFATANTWHVFGHARANESGTELNYWATPFAVKVRDYNLTLVGVPTTANDDTNFTFTLNVTALGLSDNATTDHIGAHYFNDTESSTTELAAGDCSHVSGGVVGTHSVSCRVDQGQGLSRDVYVRGHIRVTEGGVTLSWWSQPYRVTVSALGGVGVPGLPG